MQILNGQQPLLSKQSNGIHLSNDQVDKKTLHTTSAKVAPAEVIPPTTDPSLAWKYNGKTFTQGKQFNYDISGTKCFQN
jgi:hypothetical protein